MMVGVGNPMVPPQRSAPSTSGWWFGTMEFYDFPETVWNVTFIIFRGAGIPPARHIQQHFM